MSTSVTTSSHNGPRTPHLDNDKDGRSVKRRVILATGLAGLGAAAFAGPGTASAASPTGTASAASPTGTASAASPTGGIPAGHYFTGDYLPDLSLYSFNLN